MTTKNLENHLEEKCPECNSRTIKTSNLEVCSNCGLEIRQIFDYSSKRAFTQEEKESRNHNAPETKVLPHSSDTKIIWTDKDASGNGLNPKQRGKFYRLSKIDRSVTTTLKRNLSETIPKLEMISSKLKLPKQLTEQAKLRYKQAVEKKLTRGRSNIDFVGVSFLVAGRELKQEISIDELVSATYGLEKSDNGFKEARKKLRTTYRLYYEELSLKIEQDIEQPVSRVCQEIANIVVNQKGALEKKDTFAVELGNFIINRINLLKNLNYVSGKNPLGLIASLAYIGTGLISPKYGKRATQPHISNICGVSEVTLRNGAKKIEKILEKHPEKPETTENITSKNNLKITSAKQDLEEISLIEPMKIKETINKIVNYTNLKEKNILEDFVKKQVIYLSKKDYISDENKNKVLAGLVYVWFKLYGLNYGRNLTPDDIAGTLGLSKPEVYEHYKNILNALPEEIKEEWKNEFGRDYIFYLPQKEMAKPVKFTEELEAPKKRGRPRKNENVQKETEKQIEMPKEEPRAYLEIQRIAENLNLSKEIIDKAYDVYNKKIKKIRGKQNAFVAASLLVAGEEMNQNIPLENLVKSAYINVKTEEDYKKAEGKITNSYSLIKTTKQTEEHPQVQELKNEEMTGKEILKQETTEVESQETKKQKEGYSIPSLLEKLTGYISKEVIGQADKISAEYKKCEESEKKRKIRGQLPKSVITASILKAGKDLKQKISLEELIGVIYSVKNEVPMKKKYETIFKEITDSYFLICKKLNLWNEL